MVSIEARSKQTFLHNEFEAFGKWNMPIIRKTELDLVGVNLISYTDLKTNDIDENKQKGVHFYMLEVDGVVKRAIWLKDKVLKCFRNLFLSLFCPSSFITFKFFPM